MRALREVVLSQEGRRLAIDSVRPVVMRGVIRSLESDGSHHAPSRHEAHELTYVRGGAMRYIVNQEEYPLRQGELFVLKPGMEHTYVIDEGPVDLLIVYFTFAPDAFLMQLGEQTISLESIDQFVQFAEEAAHEEHKEAGIYLRGRGHKRIVRLCEQCLQESLHERFCGALMREALAMELVVEVARQIKEIWEDNLRRREGKVQELIEMAERYMREHVTEPLTVAEIANYVFLSHSYFARSFQRSYGMTPSNYLNALRVDLACELLAKEELQVGAVARRVGFGSSQRMNVSFRRLKGMTALEYRKKMRA